MRRFIEDWLCWGNTIQLTSPTGSVEIDVCDGWCQRWTLRVHDSWEEGHGIRRLKRTMRDIAERATWRSSIAGSELLGLVSSLEAAIGRK